MFGFGRRTSRHELPQYKLEIKDNIAIENLQVARSEEVSKLVHAFPEGSW